MLFLNRENISHSDSCIINDFRNFLVFHFTVPYFLENCNKSFSWIASCLEDLPMWVIIFYNLVNTPAINN